MRCPYVSAKNCEECTEKPFNSEHFCEVHDVVVSLQEKIKTDCILGKTKVSPNHQIALIKEVRPWIPAQPGDYLQYRKLRNGMVIIELSKDDGNGGEK